MIIVWSCSRYSLTSKLPKGMFQLATGDGEKLMEFCPSFQVVQLLKQGLSPQNACESVLKSTMHEKGHAFEAGLIALDSKVIFNEYFCIVIDRVMLVHVEVLKNGEMSGLVNYMMDSHMQFGPKERTPS